MIHAKAIRVLLVEDSPSDLLLIRALFAEATGDQFILEHTNRMDAALRLLKEQVFDAVLLDLGLPDSQGVDTFVQLHRVAPGIPILVLTALEDSNTDSETIRHGAEDYLVKQQIHASLLRNSVRYAVMRTEARQAEDENRHREEQNREMLGLDRLSTPARTQVTARMFSGSPLHEYAPEEFRSAVAEFDDLLGLALEQRAFGTDEGCSSRLHELGLQLGISRGGPRDIVEIYLNALKRRTKDVPAVRVQAYLEEGRIMAFELMGHLTSYYRSFYTSTKVRE